MDFDFESGKASHRLRRNNRLCFFYMIVSPHLWEGGKKREKDGTGGEYYWLASLSCCRRDFAASPSTNPKKEKNGKIIGHETSHS